MERKVLNNPGGGDLVIIQGRICDTGFWIWRGKGKSTGNCLLKCSLFTHMHFRTGYPAYPAVAEVAELAGESL